MEKVVCYCITRNLYKDIGPAVWSMARNGNVDRIVIIAEDDSIGIDLPEIAEVRNMAEQTYFWEGGPNYRKKWTYMALMKTAMAKIFPDLSRILTLDHDTIVLGDISALWDMPLIGYDIAGCNEPYWKHQFGHDYINAGVLMWNLDKIRESKKDDMMITLINTADLRLPEQDCINRLCQFRIRVIDSAYNFCDYVDPPQEPVRILHFAGKAGRESWMRIEIWGDKNE